MSLTSTRNLCLPIFIELACHDRIGFISSACSAGVTFSSSSSFLVHWISIGRYAIVLYGLKAKDKKNLYQLLRKAIREVFQSEAIDEEVIEEYMSALSHLTFAKTKNRTLVARLNKQCENVLFGEKFLEIDSIVQVKMSKWISSLLAGDGKGGYFHPNEAMERDLLELNS
ncbi:hypothetical protein RKD52_000412 [Metabacillus sp. SLBN-84]